MINDAYVFLAGYVATEPTFKKVAGGVSFVRLRIAYSARRLNRETGEWTDGPTSFVSVQCWRGLADNVAMCLRKGEPVLVRGRLQVRRYETSDGSPRIAVEVDATAVGHDLTRGVAHFSRTRRSAGETAAEYAGVQASQADGPADARADGPGDAHPDGPADAQADGRTPVEHGESGIDHDEGEHPAAAPDAGAPAAGASPEQADPESGASPGSHEQRPGPGNGREEDAGDSVVDEDTVEELARELAASLDEDRTVKAL
jgi:single-strand DNA-binding protein